MNKGIKNVLVYPRPYFVEDYSEIKQQGEKRLNLVLNKTSAENQWLVCRGNLPSTENKRKGQEPNSLTIRLIDLKDNLHPSSLITATDFLSDGHFYMYSDIDNPTKPKSISGYLKYENELQNIDELYTVGAGMLKTPTINSNFAYIFQRNYDCFLDSEYAKNRWRMTIKALGEDVWKRLCSLKVMIIGCGRSGAKMFGDLAGIGIGNIIVCDPDVLELGNLGEIGLFLTDKDIGRNKAEVLVERVSAARQTNEETDCFDFQAVKGYNFGSYDTQKLNREVDVIILCVDSDGGRSYASYLAARYHKVLLDVGTGILGKGEKRREGYDVRLILPTDGCLECCGGLDEQQAEIEMFNSKERQRLRTEGHLQREGSLSSLSSIAVGEGIGLLQDLCKKDKMRNSAWIKFERNTGRIYKSPIERTKIGNCDCEGAGLGDFY